MTEKTQLRVEYLVEGDHICIGGTPFIVVSKTKLPYSTMLEIRNTMNDHILGKLQLPGSSLIEVL